MYEPAKMITHVIQIRDGLTIREQYDVPSRSDALTAIAEARSARPGETIELITTETFQ